MKDIGNVFWRNITDGWKVVDGGYYYAAVLPGGKEYKVITWDGESGVEAQKHLRYLVRKDAAPTEKESKT